MPRPVRSASATMRLEIWWLMSAAKRASLRRRLFSSRRAELVPLACNRFRSRCLSPAVASSTQHRRLAHRSLVVAMLTMPISTPRNPLTGCDQRDFGRLDGGMQKPLAVAVDQVGFPDRTAAQHHQMLWIARRSEMFFNRPATVQIDIVAARPRSSGNRQDKHRASNGCARRGPKHNRRIFDLAAPVGSWRTTVASSNVGAQRSVGIGDLANHADRRLRRQPEPIPQLSAEVTLGINLAEHPVGMHLRRQPRRRRIASSQGLIQRCCLPGRRQRPQLYHLLHATDASPSHRHPGSASAPTRIATAPAAIFRCRSTRTTSDSRRSYGPAPQESVPAGRKRPAFNRRGTW